MRLEDLRVELRPRSAWEAVDLGLVMVRAWSRPLHAAWLTVLLPAAAAALALLGPGRGLLLLWWLKPLFDRVLLDVLSRSVFGESPRVPELLRRLPGLLRGWLPEALLLRRLDPARSLRLPTWQLEGLRGGARASRARLLDPGAAEVGSLLTVTGFLMELGLALALLALPALLVPEWTGLDWGDSLGAWLDGSGAAWMGWCAAGALVLSFALLEPFYVAGGFALYLNRRTLLEGWDLEIAFRRLAARVRSEEERRRATGRRAGAAPALLALLLLAPAPPAGAAGPEREPAVEAAAERVLASPDFERARLERRWRLREDLLEWLDLDREARPVALGAWLAVLAEVLLWALAAVLLGWLLVAGLRRAGWLRARRRPGRREPPRFVAGHDISPESLPEDPADEATRLWARGLRTEALGLLYRASLARLVEHDALPLRESHTEGDCLAAAQAALPPARAGLFRRLTLAWQQAAYAHRPPDDETGSALIDDWAAGFGAAA